MKHDHAAFVGAGHNQAGCLICTATDRAGLIERVAADLWESRQTGDDFIPWSGASDYWKRPFRQMAETAIDSLAGSSACIADISG